MSFLRPRNPFTISKLYFTTLFRVKNFLGIYFTTFSCRQLASFFMDSLVLASLAFADMDNGGRDDEQFIFISLRARLPNRIYIFIIDQPHLCFRLDTIEWSSFTNHYLWRHSLVSSLKRIARFHRVIFIQMETKNFILNFLGKQVDSV